MTDPYSDLLASAPMRAMHAAETTALTPELGGMHGAHGLCICAGSQVELPQTPMLGTWVRLIFGTDERFAGDVSARSDEPLPFSDDAFRVVVLSHVLEWTPYAASLLDEVTRVLAPNGLVAITGFHPLAVWWPWVMWRARRSHPGFAVIAPMWLRSGLARRDIDIYATHRFGPAWPTSRHDDASRSGGCYLMLGRKQRQAITPLRLRDARSRSLASSAFAAGAQRECA